MPSDAARIFATPHLKARHTTTLVVPHVGQRRVCVQRLKENGKTFRDLHSDGLAIALFVGVRFASFRETRVAQPTQGQPPPFQPPHLLTSIESGGWEPNRRRSSAASVPSRCKWSYGVISLRGVSPGRGSTYCRVGDLGHKLRSCVPGRATYKWRFKRPAFMRLRQNSASPTREWAMARFPSASSASNSFVRSCA